MPSSRREFLRLLSSSLVLSAGGDLLAHVPANSENGIASGKISSWTTDETMTYRRSQGLSWSDSNLKSAGITIDNSQTFQEMLGFGGAFTDAACFNFNKLEPEVRNSLFRELFGPFDHSNSGLNLNVCRTCIGSSDYSTEAYTYDEGEPDPELKRFSIERDRGYILPMLRLARKVNPDLFLFSTPWTPPGWMKANKSMLGGNMRPKYMESYANYFTKFLHAYADQGVPIQAVTIQNELDTDQDGRMPACSWPQEYEEGFVRQCLGPALKREKLETKIWLIDHNYNLWGRAICELQSDDMRKFVDGIAWHGYLGQPEWMTRVHDAYPNINMYWTEGGPDYTSKDYGTNWVYWSRTFAGVLQNWCRSITAWNLALDEKGKPNIGPFSCGGLVTITDEGGVVRSGQYWALAHYSAHIMRGAKRIASKSIIADLQNVAFANPDGSTVVVLTNSSAANIETQLACGARSTTVVLPKQSVSTFVWKG